METELFVSEVLLPLASRRGALVVRGPIDADDFAALIEAHGTMPGSAELALARKAVVARFLRDAPTSALDRDALAIGVAIHNLCFLLGRDPKEEGKKVMTRIAAYTARLATLPPPEDEVELCARHALVAPLRTLDRRDVHVRFWAGEQSFRGETPPARLLRWQTVRRVRQDQTHVALFDAALKSPPLRAIVVALLASSPLTELLDIAEPEPPLELANAARWLEKPHIARVVADEYLANGIGGILVPVGTALLSVYNKVGATRAATVATEFHSHLHLLDLLSRPQRDREGHLQILRGHIQGRERAAATSFGLYAAADRLGLGRPRDLASDPALVRNANAYVDACVELVGPRHLNDLIGAVARGVGDNARVVA